MQWPTDETPTYKTLAEAIRSMEVRAVPVEGREDVCVMLEHMQKHISARHDEQETREARLCQREAQIAAQEKELLQGLRAIGMLRSVHPARTGWRRYLGR